MINQEKVLRMTKMASYEEHGGRKDRAVVGYFRSDYIGKQTIISLIVITAAFLAGLGAYLVFHFLEIPRNCLFPFLFAMMLLHLIYISLLSLFFLLMMFHLQSKFSLYCFHLYIQHSIVLNCHSIVFLLHLE